MVCGSEFSEKTPTLRQQVKLFHQIMNIASMAQVSGKSDHIRACIFGMDDWSYAHRVGNGENSERQQKKIINRAFWRLQAIADDYKTSGSLS